MSLIAYHKNKQTSVTYIYGAVFKQINSIYIEIKWGVYVSCRKLD